MESSQLRENQLAMARYLRDPENESPPAGIEARRLKVYEDLVYNNIESFLTSGFPVLHSLYGEADWRQLVRHFMQDHRCHSPYFLEISQEFLQFLMHDHAARPCDAPYMAELAHYEWVELALNVSEDEVPPSAATADTSAAIPQLSPLAWSLAYQYPVHGIGPANPAPDVQGPTFLVVYRNRADDVEFMEVNAASARLLELVRDNEQGQTVMELLARLADEMGASLDAIQSFGCEQVEQFEARSVVWYSAPS